jgi:probable HAF family extracellular repeat protein
MAPRFCRAGVAVALLFTAPHAGLLLAADPPAYVVEDVGSLGGDTLARAINRAGAAAGYSALPDGTFHAFVTTPTGAILELPTLGGPTGQAFGLNDAGWVSGSSQTETGRVHAFRAAPAADPIDLGTLGGNTSFGYGLNANGVVVGYSATVDGVSHAFRYTDAGGLEDLGTLGGPHSYAWAVNASGVVVGQSYLADRTAHGFVWANGVMTDIGTLGGRTSNATSVNADGLVVGAAMDPSGNWHAFRKPPGAPLEDLGTLGGRWSGAEGVNGAGDVVGWSHTAAGPMHAILWTPALGLVDLNSLIDPAAGWTLVAAYGINDSGQITGYGYFGTQLRAFRLSLDVPVDVTPPVIQQVSATPPLLEPANHRMVPIAVAVAATDDSGAQPTCVVTDVASNEPDNGQGDGDTPGDIVREGSLSLGLRAERSGTGSGRVYSIAVMCTDEAGNTASGATTVVVPKGTAGGGAKPKPKN